MSKNSTKLRIATSYEQWKDVDAHIDHAVANLINGDAQNAERLLMLVDLMTAERFESHERESVIYEVKSRAFMQSTAFEHAMAAFMAKVNPLGHAERKTA